MKSVDVPVVSSGPLAPGSVTDAFRAVVRQHGERVALEADGSQLTYAELDTVSSRIANGLLERGTAEPVAMVATLEPVTIAVLLGALKAGRVFVPLDPRDPPERVLLVCEQLGALMVSPDGLGELQSGRDDDPALAIGPYQRSLVYFTSGSSGRPKGTVKSHKELTWAPIAYGITAADRFAMVIPLAFAASITPVFGTLLSGATGCLFDPIRRGIGPLAEWIDEAGVTVVKMVPSLLHSVAAAMAERGRSAPSVRLAIVAGEPLAGSQLAVVRQVLPSAAVTNLYGSTEAGYIAATTIEPGEPVDAGAIPFRRVFPWQTLEIVDESERPVAPGETGEILVRGTDISLGYWEEPDESAPRFSYEQNGMRAIRTGDRGRLRPDGSLELLGRTDLRVKVHGQMVDPQAVESALAALPDVREAVVSPLPALDGGTRLVAHVRPETGATPTQRELRLGLAERLPSFMIPSAFVRIDEIPRTSRGKVDRRVLREAAAAAAPVEVEYTAPRDPREQALADVVAEVLGAERVGAQDDFFELGADSLSVVELLAAIDERFRVSLAPGDLLEAPTIGALARRLDTRAAHGTVVPLSLRGSGRPFFCVPGGGGVPLMLRGLARRLDRPAYSFVPRGRDRRALPDRTVERAAGRYVEALRTIQASGPYLLGGYSFGGLVAYEMARQLRAAGETVALLVLLDAGSDEELGSYVARARRVAAGASGGSRSRAASRLLRRAVIHGRHTFRVASAGAVQWSEWRQRGRVFIVLSRRMSRRYRPEPYGGPTLVVRSAVWETVDDVDLTRFLTGDVRTVDVPGDHYSMLREPHVVPLAAALRDAFAAIEQ